MIPAWAQVDWIAWAMSVIGLTERVSIVTVKPIGSPA